MKTAPIPETHEQVEYLIPILVDVKVLPLVAALNDISDVRTLYSCQGLLTSEVDTRAHVGFLAPWKRVDELVHLLKDGHLANVTDWSIEILYQGHYVLYVSQEHVPFIVDLIREHIGFGDNDVHVTTSS